MGTEKSRDLNLKEFLHLLQYEYVSSRIRSSIHVKQNDIKYWNKVSVFKKEKILNVSERLFCINNNIFTNVDELKKYINLCIPKFGILSLSYKDNAEFELLSQKEKQLYYIKDAKIISNSPNSLYEYEGIISEVNYKREVLTLKEENDVLHTFLFSEVRRVFNDSIWLI